MSRFKVESIPYGAVTDSHSETGPQTRNGISYAVPAFVDPPGPGAKVPLEFDKSGEVRITSLLFKLDTNLAPNWLAVAVPNGLTSFTHVNLFCHPNPGRAQMYDED
jgi:hypothetical protein